MSDTLFAFIKGSASNANDTDPETSSVFYNPPMETVQNVTVYCRETVPLDSGDTRTISLPDAASGNWTGIMARVIGHAKITTVGTNWDGSTAVTGITAGYGTERHAGYISMVTTKVTSFTLAGLADDTTVEYLAMKFVTDDTL